MLFDTFAWIEYFEGTRLGEQVRQFLEDNPTAYTCPVVLAEVISKSTRRYGEQKTLRYLDYIRENCAIIHHTEGIGIAAGRIHAEMKKRRPTFGMADAFVLASARDRGVKVLTGDPHFQGLEDAILLDAPS